MLSAFCLDSLEFLWVSFIALGLLYSSWVVLCKNRLVWECEAQPPFLRLGQTQSMVYTHECQRGIRPKLALDVKRCPSVPLPLPCPISPLPPRLCSWKSQPRPTGCCAGPVKRRQGGGSRNGERGSVSRIF